MSQASYNMEEEEEKVEEQIAATSSSQPSSSNPMIENKLSELSKLPERIMLCIDICAEMDDEGHQGLTRLQQLQRFLPVSSRRRSRCIAAVRTTEAHHIHLPPQSLTNRTLYTLKLIGMLIINLQSLLLMVIQHLMLWKTSLQILHIYFQSSMT